MNAQKSLPIFLCPTAERETLVIRAASYGDAIEQACVHLGNGWHKHDALHGIVKDNKFLLLSRFRFRDPAKLPPHFSGSNEGYVHL